MLVILRCACIAMVVFTGFAEIVLAKNNYNDFPPQIDANERGQILEWVSKIISTQYVYPKVAKIMEEQILSHTEQGAYAGVDHAEDFLYAIEQDLRSTSGDKHIGLWAEPIEDATIDDIDYTPADKDYVEHLRMTNFGYKKIEIFPGNIAYLRIDEFPHPALGGLTTIAVMNTIGHADAVIIDLRWNGGGAGMVGTVSAYFFNQPTLLNAGWDRASGKTEQVWTPEHVPGPSLSDVPLYILISGQTFSAAEAFTYGLKHLDRATVVGTRSKGGAHSVNFYRLLLDDFAVAMMVPNAKPIHPVTGTNWERVGVIPDIQTSPEKALGAAYNAALDTLLKKAGNEQFRARLEWARADFLAGQQSIVLSTELLTEYSGTYGNRVFIVGDDNNLLYQPEPGSAFMLTPLGNNLFGVEGFDHRRFRFERDSKGIVYRVTSLDIDGTSITRDRVKQE